MKNLVKVFGIMAGSFALGASVVIAPLACYRRMNAEDIRGTVTNVTPFMDKRVHRTKSSATSYEVPVYDVDVTLENGTQRNLRLDATYVPFASHNDERNIINTKNSATTGQLVKIRICDNQIIRVEDPSP